MNQRWVSCQLPGAPPSVNDVPLDTRDYRYRSARDAWQRSLAFSFSEAGNVLPRQLERVYAQAVIAYPTDRRRDSGNVRALLEKWLGDTLQATGRLEDDTHDRYEFGRVMIRTDRSLRAPQTQLLLDVAVRGSDVVAQPHPFADWEPLGQLLIRRSPHAGTVAVHCTRCQSIEVEHDTDLNAIQRRHRCPHQEYQP